MTAHNKLLFVINTFSAQPGAVLGLKEGAGAAHTQPAGNFAPGHDRIGLGIWIPAADLIWRCLAVPLFPPFARGVLWTGRCEKIKQTSWHNDSQLFRSPQLVSRIKSRLLNAANEDFSLSIAFASWGWFGLVFFALFERFSKFQVVERQLYSETENVKSAVSFKKLTIICFFPEGTPIHLHQISVCKTNNSGLR